MKKITFHFLLLFSITEVTAQTLDFTLASPQPNLIEAYSGSFASGDIDGDGDKDLLMTGITPAGSRSKLYLNNGSGNFTETTTILPTDASSSVTIFKDLDGDTDLDLFFSGNRNIGGAFTHIYTNNGSGVFTLVNNPALPIFTGTGAAIADVDNDGDQDIVISTRNSSNVFVADVYKNNGSAVFTAQASAAFTPVKFAAIAFIDMENDGDQDVIISGQDASNVSSIKLYQNNGSGIYTLNTNSTFLPISAADVDVADTDGDGDLDFLVSGSQAGSIANTILYISNGSGVFTQTATSLQQTFAGKNAFADLDNDGDQDVLIVGSQAGGFPNIFNIAYQNTGNNVFVQADVLGGEYIADCIIDDFTGDGLKDVIIQGFANDTNVYWNTSTNLGINNPEISNQAVTFFPNPAKDIVTFKSSENIDKITIYNLLGQEFFSKEINSNETTVDVSNFSNGTYIAKMTSNGKTESLKLVKM
jgi:Secretion system C-terminal sorting domain/FG-GAP-like repeat